MMHLNCFGGASKASSSGDSSTLVNSRQGSCKEEDWSTLADEVPVISEGPVAESEALALLQNKLQGTGKHKYEHMVKLSRELGHVPLAIELAAAYIIRRKKTITEYLQAFCSNTHPMRAKFLDSMMNVLPDDTRSTDIIIMKTWYISFKHICRYDQRAPSLLLQMSFCDRQSIPQVIFKKTPTVHGSNDESEYDFVFWVDVQKLKRFCFITTGVDDTFIMHRLVQLATRHWLRMYDDDKRYKGLLIHRLKGVFPSTNVGEENVLSQALFPHVREVFTTNPDMFICYTDSSILLCRAAQYSILNGNSSIGMMFLNGILEREEKSFRGREYIKELQWSEAEESFLEGKRIVETASGKESKLTCNGNSPTVEKSCSLLDTREEEQRERERGRGREREYRRMERKRYRMMRAIGRSKGRRLFGCFNG